MSDAPTARRRLLASLSELGLLAAAPLVGLLGACASPTAPWRLLQWPALPTAWQTLAGPTAQVTALVTAQAIGRGGRGRPCRAQARARRRPPSGS